MARKRNTPTAKGASDPVTAMLKLAGTQGYEGLSLADIAAEAGIGLGQLLSQYPSKAALLGQFLRQLDQATLPPAGIGEDGDSPRDRLFAAIMRRFDALQPHRQAVAAIVRAAPREPGTIAVGLCGIKRAARWMLEAAGIEAEGWRGLVRRRALAAIYADVFRIWLTDDSADLAKTMARLDQRLKWAETAANRFARPAVSPA